MEHEHELVDMWVSQFEMFYGKPTINKRKSKVCNICINKLVYASKGHVMKMGNVLYKKLKFFFP
jgi:hypothetical protein